MSDRAAISRFVENLHQDVRARAEGAPDGAADEAVFTEMMIELLQEFGEVDDASPCHYEKKGVKVNGYGVSEDQTTLDLFVSECDWQVPPGSYTQTRLTQAIKRARVFFDQAGHDDLGRTIAESHPAYDMASHISGIKDTITKVRIFVFTDAVAKQPETADEEHNGVYFTHHLWDAERLYRCESSGRKREPVFADFNQLGGPIPVLSLTESDAYTAYLAIMPGPVLARLYEKWGARLLERNVRTFLQARGKVNQGIRETLVSNPEMFFTYNNGISTTAESAQIVELGPQLKGIASLHDFQIVNGGQTTASIFNTYWKDKADLSKVRVQMKLTVVTNPDRLDDFVANISRYSNTQNNVSTADFASNDPFHRQIEELSRTVWAPDPLGGKNQTRWYYERARGQYNDEKARQGSRRRIEAWATLHPPKQRFTKTDLAKYVHSWEQLPHLVSRGSQKNFAHFSIRLKEDPPGAIDQDYFRSLVAEAILFRRADTTIDRMQLGGYKAQVVTYTVAWLSHISAQRIDRDALWDRQDISAALQAEIERLAKIVYDHLAKPPGGQNVTEWCKKEQCWKSLLEIRHELPSQLESEMLSRNSKPRRTQKENQREAENAEAVVAVGAIPAEVWFELANWAKVTDNLASWQRSMCFNTGRKVAAGGDLSRLAKHAWNAYQEALTKGFKPGVQRR